MAMSMALWTKERREKILPMIKGTYVALLSRLVSTLTTTFMNGLIDVAR